MSNERNDRGQFVERVALDDVLDVLVSANEPVTAREVSEEFSITSRAALNKLNKLHARGDVRRKKVGGRSVVWWLGKEDYARGGSPDPLFGLVGLFGDDNEAAALARERSEEWGEAFDQQMMSAASQKEKDANADTETDTSDGGGDCV